MDEELKLLHSSNVDQLMNNVQDEDDDQDTVSVMDAFREGQTALEQMPVKEGPKSNVANLVVMQ